MKSKPSHPTSNHLGLNSSQDVSWYRSGFLRDSVLKRTIGRDGNSSLISFQIKGHPNWSLNYDVKRPLWSWWKYNRVAYLRLQLQYIHIYFYYSYWSWLETPHVPVIERPELMTWANTYEVGEEWTQGRRRIFVIGRNDHGKNEWRIGQSGGTEQRVWFQLRYEIRQQ